MVWLHDGLLRVALCVIRANSDNLGKPGGKNLQKAMAKGKKVSSSTMPASEQPGAIRVGPEVVLSGKYFTTYLPSFLLCRSPLFVLLTLSILQLSLLTWMLLLTYLSCLAGCIC